VRYYKRVRSTNLPNIDVKCKLTRIRDTSDSDGGEYDDRCFWNVTPNSRKLMTTVRRNLLCPFSL
jgi:hypothetical protein